MSTRVITPLLSVVGLLLVGCSDVQRRTYNVSVRNESDTPVTVWLTKDSSIYEREWRSPEDLAIESRDAGEAIAGNVVRPGETQSANVAGQFHPRDTAVLRIYYGQHNFSDLLAISSGSPDRKEYELEPGHNSFTIRSDGAALRVLRGERPADEGETAQTR